MPGILLGRSAVLEVSTDGGSVYNPVGNVSDVSLDRTVDETDTTTFDDAGDRAFLPNHSDQTISFTLKVDETAGQLDTIWTSLLTKVIHKWRLKSDDDSGVAKQLDVDAFVSSASEGHPMEDVMGLDVSLRGTGVLTRTTQA